MRQYELMIMVSPSAMADEKNTPKEAIEALFKKLKISVLKLDEWGEKNLAYEIKKHDRGYYLVYYVSCLPKAADSFKQKIALEKGILRWLMMLSEEEIEATTTEKK